MICQTADQVEMHHVRRIKDVRSGQKLDFFTTQMAGINRKQVGGTGVPHSVPLCKTHHIDWESFRERPRTICNWLQRVWEGFIFALLPVWNEITSNRE